MIVEPGHIVRIGPFEIPGVAAQRHVRLYIPRNRPKKKPPRALFLFDGQNVFDDGPSFSGGWHLHTLSERMRGRAPVLIALEHGGSARIDELSPFATEKSRGLAGPLVDWMADFLVPFLGVRLGLEAPPWGSMIGGSSMGGLAAMYAHFRRPDRFGAALVMSPSFWFARGAILADIAHRPRPPTSRIYLDIGAREGGGMVSLAERMAHDLGARGYGPDALRFRLDPRGTHSERDWRRRAPSALRYLLKD